MKLTNREKAYQAQYLNQVCHTTLDPRDPGVVRIHLVPPRPEEGPETPFLVILNGQEILPISFSWAVLLSAFMRNLNQYDGREIPPEDYASLVRHTALEVRKVYPLHPLSRFTKDLDEILDVLVSVAHGQRTDAQIAPLSIFEYADRMRAPHRMDLMVSAMTDENGHWNCNHHCLHCYAAGQPLSKSRGLSTDEWKKIIDRCREACIAQLTFTGGEPTMREDLPQLIAHASFFITRLNTNGVLLDGALCKKLYDASLDNVQVTLYSSDRAVHERLVGASRFDDTLNGIKNALDAGLSLSVNTPLCALNRDYVKTLEDMAALGVRYFTCSGLIPTGGALTEQSRQVALPREELLSVLKDAFSFCEKNALELQFTTPGLFSASDLLAAGATQVPSCGAALSNMAVAPDGTVVPCQSWLGEGLGNLLELPFDRIWDSPRCREIRARSARREEACQLSAKEEKPS